MARRQAIGFSRGMVLGPSHALLKDIETRLELDDDGEIAELLRHRVFDARCAFELVDEAGALEPFVELALREIFGTLELSGLPAATRRQRIANVLTSAGF